MDPLSLNPTVASFVILIVLLRSDLMSCTVCVCVCVCGFFHAVDGQGELHYLSWFHNNHITTDEIGLPRELTHLNDIVVIDSIVRSNLNIDLYLRSCKPPKLRLRITVIITGCLCLYNTLLCYSKRKRCSRNELYQNI